MKVKVVFCSEMSVTIGQITRRPVLEAGILHQQDRSVNNDMNGIHPGN
jgi:hypothetical protein